MMNMIMLMRLIGALLVMPIVIMIMAMMITKTSRWKQHECNSGLCSQQHPGERLLLPLPLLKVPPVNNHTLNEMQCASSPPLEAL
jgi:hypothetical protein